MRGVSLLIAVLAAAGAAGLALPAMAQDEVMDPPVETTPPAAPAAGDPIGDVLSGLAATQGMDDDAAETATATSPDADGGADGGADGDAEDPSEPAISAAPPAYTPVQPFIPPPPVSRLPQLDRPVMIDELWRSPEAPPTAVEQAYEGRIRGGLNAAQGLQGPLDGGWVLRGADGKTLYGLQLVDKGTGGQPLEGAWRSLKPGQPAGQVGLVDSIDRTVTGVYVRFTPRGAREASILTLSPVAGGWAGELWEAGSTRPVTLRRN